MKNLAVLSLLVLLTMSCSSDSNVLLRWDPSGSHYYRLTKDVFPIAINVDIDAMLNDPELLVNKVMALRNIPLSAEKMPMQLSMQPGKDDEIEVLAKNVNIIYDSPAKDENEQRQRQRQERLDGVVQLNTAINESGRIQHNFNKNLQRNLVAFLFHLPEKKIAVGDSWDIPVTLSSLNTPFLADTTQRINKVWLDNISEVPGYGKVATVIYLIKENIEGYKQHTVTQEPEPFKVTATWFAVGEFILDENQWLRYTGRLETVIGEYNYSELIAMVPDKGAHE